MFSSGLQVVLIGSHPISSCGFGVPVSGGELRVFLLCHLGRGPLEYWIKSVFRSQAGDINLGFIST